MTFRDKMNHLTKRLQLLKRRGTINEKLYRDYKLLILDAIAPEQLDQIVHDLEEIQQPVYLPVPSFAHGSETSTDALN